MRSLILSQCRDLRIGVTREDLGVDKGTFKKLINTRGKLELMYTRA